MWSYIDAIQKRHSVRNYSSRPVEKEKIRQLAEYIGSNRKGPLGSDVRFKIVDGTDYTESELKRLGTYGLMKGARLFIAGAVNRNRYAMEDFGYCMEKNILAATAMGLGTCWQGGTLNRSSFALELELAENEIVPAVSPAGYAELKDSIKGRVASLSMKSRKRKEPREIFFDSSINGPLDTDNEEFATVLDCVRWAPSAGNMQPWRIYKDNSTFHFFMKENSSYNNSTSLQGLFPGKGHKLQNIDMGIAMAHFDLAACELGLPGCWKVNEELQESSGLKYIASWTRGAI